MGLAGFHRLFPKYAQRRILKMHVYCCCFASASASVSAWRVGWSSGHWPDRTRWSSKQVSRRHSSAGQLKRSDDTQTFARFNDSTRVRPPYDTQNARIHVTKSARAIHRPGTKYAQFNGIVDTKYPDDYLNSPSRRPPPQSSRSSHAPTRRGQAESRSYTSAAYGPKWL